ncbi:hypothetical protein D3C85_1706000 [compost metagenome]
MPKPTPAGVPLMITSPASSVIASLSVAIRVATSKIMSLVLADCTTWPFRRVSSCKPLPPAGSSSAVTSSGPNAPVSSKFFPTVHCGDLNWYSRTEASLNSA